MNIQITVEILLSFLIPGSFAVLAISNMNVHLANSIITLMKNPSIPSLILFGVLSIIFGAVIDIISAVIFKGFLSLVALVRRQNNKNNIPIDYIKVINKENLDVFLALVERTHLYTRLSRGSCFAITFLAAFRIFYSYGPSIKVGTTEIGIFVVAAVLGIAAFQGEKYTTYTMRQFYHGHKGKNLVT
jgi:hypothetical protein